MFEKERRLCDSSARAKFGCTIWGHLRGTTSEGCYGSERGTVAEEGKEESTTGELKVLAKKAHHEEEMQFFAKKEVKKRVEKNSWWGVGIENRITATKDRLGSSSKTEKQAPRTGTKTK